MSKTEIYKCDSCGATRGIDNHWFTVVVRTADITKEKKPVTLPGIIEIRKFTPDHAEMEGALHICSAECIAKIVIQNHDKL